ncbi:hypothetical protein ACTHGU_00285 [Chitinophagaceae bacterium MMS25-I14]
MQKKIHILITAFLCACLASCHTEPRQVTRSFYYWKTIYNPDSFETGTMKKLHCSKLYLRYFDADLNEAGQPQPVSIIRLPEQMDTTIAYVPVFFITQKLIAALPDSTIPFLANNINRLLTTLTENAHISPKEVQCDCDWTGGSRDRYFSLLKALKQQPFFKNKILSCTIRLHQVKYLAKSGVPPVDKGMLMCYNMGDLKKSGEHNSILDVPLAKDYLQHLSGYPLPLDIALPLFGWSLLFHENRFAGILRGVEPAMLNNDTIFRKTSVHQYACIRDTNWHGYFLKKNDIIRTEETSYDDVLQMAKFAAENIKNRTINISLYHLDSSTISKYEPQQLEKIYTAFE